MILRRPLLLAACLVALFSFNPSASAQEAPRAAAPEQRRTAEAPPPRIPWNWIDVDERRLAWAAGLAKRRDARGELNPQQRDAFQGLRDALRALRETRSAGERRDERRFRPRRPRADAPQDSDDAQPDSRRQRPRLRGRLRLRGEERGSRDRSDRREQRREGELDLRRRLLDAARELGQGLFGDDAQDRELLDRVKQLSEQLREHSEQRREGRTERTPRRDSGGLLGRLRDTQRNGEESK